MFYYSDLFSINSPNYIGQVPDFEKILWNAKPTFWSIGGLRWAGDKASQIALQVSQITMDTVVFPIRYEKNSDCRDSPDAKWCNLNDKRSGANIGSRKLFFFWWWVLPPGQANDQTGQRTFLLF